MYKKLILFLFLLVDFIAQADQLDALGGMFILMIGAPIIFILLLIFIFQIFARFSSEKIKDNNKLWIYGLLLIFSTYVFHLIFDPESYKFMVGILLFVAFVLILANGKRIVKYFKSKK